MATFLSPEWFAEAGQRLEQTAPLEGAPEQALHVVFELLGAPSTGAHALTLSVSSASTTLHAGDHLAAETILTLKYDDALALSGGQLSSATALREGRIKVRGDLNKLLNIAQGLSAVFAPTSADESSN